MSCYLGDPDINFVSISKGFNIDGAVAMNPEEFQHALARARDVNREGRPFVIDAAIARRGPGAESTWHPGISIT
jgi:thiamine pyrophosphate-dependent acetolactate synthase large subunit-like protein